MLVIQKRENHPEESSAARTEAPVQRKNDSLRALAGEGFEAQAASLAPVQRRGDGDAMGGVHAAAQAGTRGSGGALPFQSAIQASFGRHDVSRVQAHTGGQATAACQAMGANAFASGNAVAFKGAPDLHTAAHEAAHVVQQRAGVSLKGGVGKSGDAYEKHADAVADAVVQGKSAEGLLDEKAGSGGAAVQQSVQQRAVQLEGGGGTGFRDPTYALPEEEKPKTRLQRFGRWVENRGEDLRGTRLGKGGTTTERLLPHGDSNAFSIWNKAAVGDGQKKGEKRPLKERAKVHLLRAGVLLGMVLAPTFTMTMAFVGGTINANRKHSKDKKGESKSFSSNRVKIGQAAVEKALKSSKFTSLCKDCELDPIQVEMMLKSRLGLEGGSRSSWDNEQLEAYATLEEELIKTFPKIGKAFTSGSIAPLVTRGNDEQDDQKMNEIDL